MKKVLLIIGTVVVLIGLTIYADRATRVKAKVSDGHDVAKADPADAPVPEVTFKDLDGKEVPLSQYKGKVVLVNFWATWCEPCQVEIPWLIEMQQKYSSKGFTILGVDVDDEGNNEVSAYTAKERFNVNGEKLPINYPILRELLAVHVEAFLGGIRGDLVVAFIVHIHAKDGEAFRRVLLLHFNEPGDFHLAGFAPRGPEIHQHDFAFVLAEGNFFAVEVLESHFGHRSVGRVGLRNILAVRDFRFDTRCSVGINGQADEHNHSADN